jgi:tRNA dimethylallyltransferase
MNKRFIVITGPTAVGKTDIAYELDPFLPCEIVNADVGQMYLPLTIGTAKPDIREHAIPHHLFNILREPINFTVQQYRQSLLAVMQEIWQRNKIPVIVGGSGFYIKSIFYPPASDNFSQSELVGGSWQELQAVDPKRAAQLHPNDQYRIDRALQIWRTTGKPPSDFVPALMPPAPFHCYVLIRDRNELYQRIDERVGKMMHAGWIEETKSLLGTPWEQFLIKKKIIGYDIIIDYLHERMSYERMVEVIAQQTRNYAKRQLTLFRSMLKDVGQVVMCSGKTDAEIVQEIVAASRK